jgi:hypothetical protein
VDEADDFVRSSLGFPHLSIVRGITVCCWGLRCNSTWAVVHHI